MLYNICTSFNAKHPCLTKYFNYYENYEIKLKKRDRETITYYFVDSVESFNRGIKLKETEFTQCLTFLEVKPSPTKTCPK